MIETVLLAINVVVLVFLAFSIEFPKNASIMFKYVPLAIATFGMIWLMTDIKGLFWTVLIIGALNALSTIITENEMPPWGVFFIKVVPFSIGVYSIVYYFTA